MVLHPVLLDHRSARTSFEDAITTSGQGFLAAVISAVLFFGSIVAHELGHALAARREGIGVAGIDLFFFGGFMRANRDSNTPGEEFRVAAAGPAVTLALAAGFGAVGIVMLGWDAFLHAAFLDFASGSLLEVIIAFTAVANAGLFALNIIPAFPLDGGRILRSIVWRLTGDRHRATTFSAYLGQGFAGLMMLYGVYRMSTRTTRRTACGGSCSAGCSAARRARRSPRATSRRAWPGSPRATSWTQSR